MIDIDDTLQLALDAASSWTSAAALNLARAIGEDGAIDWDDGAGESWIRVIDRDGRVVAFVSVDLPFVMVEEAAVPSDGSLSSFPHVVVPDLAEPALAATGQVLRDVFGNSPRLDIIDPNAFSANDLWYTTV